ncbi:MAG: ABC transporter ATP-binding protein [Thermofilaceae archaeon]
MNSPPLFLADKLGKSFGGIRALDDVTVEVSRYSLTLLIGPNGSGKTTLLNIVSGVLEPDAGRLLFKGENITKLPPYRRYELGITRTFQIPRLFYSLSVLENVLIPWESGIENPILILTRRSWRKAEHVHIEKAFKLLELLNLDHMWDSPAYELSGGQMKLLELARALMGNPSLLLLDEPLAGVNPSLAEGIMKHLVYLRNELGVTFLMVEHRLDVALRYATYVYVLHHGRVISEGPPDKVVKDPTVIEAYLSG